MADSYSIITPLRRSSLNTQLGIMEVSLLTDRSDIIRYESSEMESRKREHIEICLNEDVNHKGEGTGFERFRFSHNALPEVDFAKINISTEFVGRPLQAPLMISSMTGGTEEASRINFRLAEIAEQRGWAMGLGSMRTAIEFPHTASSFKVRHVAPTIPLIANLGAVQLNYGFGIKECRDSMEMTGADALVLHLNGMQELFQSGGNVNFSGLFRAIELLCKEADFPIGVKEVGWGIDGETAMRLTSIGVAFVDVAGAGGTSWSQVEKHRSSDPIRAAAADAFADWGIPTADCVSAVRSALPDAYLIASGGIVNGVNAAKSLALGANLASIGRALLAPALQSAETLNEMFERVEFELRAAMFGIGCENVSQLRQTDRLVGR
jgi:isopentenyl-diphosphate delta-isomerase